MMGKPKRKPSTHGEKENEHYRLVETPRALKVKIDDEGLTTSTAQLNKEGDANKKKEEKEGPPMSFHFWDLYRFATPFDKVLVFIGALGAAMNGALFPLMAIVFGNVLTGFTTLPVDLDKVNSAALQYLLVAIGLFLTCYISYAAFHYTAERQMSALRAEALKHMLYLDISWYDSNDALQLSSRLSGDTVKIKDGMSLKLGQAFGFTAQFIVGFIIGFAQSWDITLVMASLMPVMSLSLGWLVKMLQTKSEWAQKMYAQAGAVAEETLGSIRTIASLNGEKRAIEKFQVHTLQAEQENIALHKIASVVLAMFLGSVWVIYSIGLWYGGHKVSQDKMTPGEVFTAFFGVLFGTAALAHISPNITAVAQAAGAATEIFRILDTKSAIDASKDEGIIPETCEGKIEAVGVHFTYPNRPDAPILVNYNLQVESGQTVAFAGASGGGKSTLIALLERFYDPSAGQLLLDGRDIRTLNIKWLRAQIGLVSQEPVLFATTIFENIAAGGEIITRDQVITAAKLANAHTFIMSLPNNYDTLVGEKGVSLSGGQKQRVAIARAIVREPKILILDEATSALDAESEKVVQAALNDLMAKTQMTTLVIAHRLSTIRNADKIVVLNEGHIVESGTHEELLSIENGIYNNMYTIQQLRSEEEGEDIVEEQAALVEQEEQARRSSFMSTKTDTSINHVEKYDLDTPKFGLMDIARLCKPEKKYFLMGLAGVCVCGFAIPGTALLVGGMMTSMTHEYGLYLTSKDDAHLDQLYDDVTLYGILYLVVAAIIMVFTWMHSFAFKYISEKLTTRLRNVNFTSLCRQNIGFFDAKANATGALTADLATNATKVALLSGDSQGRILQAFFTLLGALLVSFGFGSWLLSLIMLAIFPLLILGNVIHMRQLTGKGAISDELAAPGAHASEVLSNIRTVVSLGLEQHSADKFVQLLEVPLKKGTMEAHINGVASGFASFIIMATYSLVFWYGAKLVNNGDIEFEQLIRTLMAILMSIEGVGGAASYFGDSRTAYSAGSKIVALRDRNVPIDPFNSHGLVLSDLQGKLEFRDVSFRYPTRPEVSVLKHYNLTIEAGQTIAFCGPSGGGKSTIVSLIERFYDPIRGEILLDGHNLKEFNVHWLRNQVGLVGQEPTLFIGTIAENIAYGLETTPTHEEIEAAAKMANAHDYITQFPDGYETQVGMKGEQLSGGQKQRIAIARAILKNPNILLLDEATSALDSESEQIVQQALDKVVALKRRTTIIIAHRLSTIRKADKICVVTSGKIAEEGTHTELLSRNGIYAKLVDSATS